METNPMKKKNLIILNWNGLFIVCEKVEDVLFLIWNM